MAEIAQEIGHQELDGSHQDAKGAQKGETTGLQCLEAAGKTRGRTAHEQGITRAEPAKTHHLNQGSQPGRHTGGKRSKQDVVRGHAGLPADDHGQKHDLAVDQHDMLHTHDQHQPQRRFFFYIIEEFIDHRAH